jgi:hypothetical protein
VKILPGGAKGKYLQRGNDQLALLLDGVALMRNYGYPAML